MGSLKNIKILFILVVFSILAPNDFSQAASISCPNALASIANYSAKSENQSLGTKWKLRNLYFTELGFALKNTEAYSSAHGLFEPTVEFYNLVSKLAVDPVASLDVEDIGYLKEHPWSKPLLQAATSLYDVQESSINVAKRIGTYWNLTPEGKYFKPRSKILRGLTASAQSLFSMVQILNPVPFLEGRPARILKRLEKNSDLVLEKSDQDFIDKRDLNQFFEDKRNLIKDQPNLVKVRRWIHNATRIAFLTSALIAANHVWQLSQHSVTPDQYAQTISMSGQSSEVDIFTDASPLPHMAVEMDGKVYSYGVTTMTTPTVEEYLHERELQGKGSQKPGALDWRAIQVERIHVDPKTKAHLKNDLEMSAYKNYKNITFVNDCATMIIRSLSRDTNVQIPQIVNASPGQVGMYLSLLHTFGAKASDGAPLVSEEFSVNVDRPGVPKVNLAKELETDIVESNMFIQIFPILEAQKGYVKLTTSEDQLQWWTPEAKAQMAQWQKDAASDVQNDAQIQFFAEKETALEKTGNTQSQLLVKKAATNYINREIKKSEDYINEPSSDLHTVITNQARLGALSQVKESFTNQQ